MQSSTQGSKSENIIYHPVVKIFAKCCTIIDGYFLIVGIISIIPADKQWEYLILKRLKYKFCIIRMMAESVRTWFDGDRVIFVLATTGEQIA